MTGRSDADIGPMPLHNLLVCAGYYEHWTGCDPRCPRRAWKESHMCPPTTETDHAK